MKTDLSFDSAGLKLAGHLYRPDNVARGPHPAIVIGHPGSGVKEQTAGLYARRLAEQGFVALTFDAAYQGESEGEPRGLEDPAHRVEDMKAATSFLSAHDMVDRGRIGALGICASGGYAMATAASDTRIKAVATVSGVDMARQFRYGADGTQAPAIFRGMLDAAAAARTAEARGEGTGVFPLFPVTESEARAGGQHVLEGYEYYCTDRAQHPRSARTFTWNSVDRLATFDAFRFVDWISPRPLLLIVGTEAVTSWMTGEAYMAAREPKEVFWIDGASHVDLYDKDEFVTPAVAKLASFFGSSLL
jgi:fermentation-respiration switch protein FrsA (DUF1100 family)